MSDPMDRDRIEEQNTGEFERPIDDEEAETGDDVIEFRKFATPPCDQPLDIGREFRRACKENFELLERAMRGRN